MRRYLISSSMSMNFADRSAESNIEVSLLYAFRDVADS